LGNYGGQRCVASCLNRPLPQQPAKSKTNKSQFKMTQRRKKASSKRPKEDREKEIKMKFKQDRRRNEKLAGTRYKLAMIEKKRTTDRKSLTKTGINLRDINLRDHPPKLRKHYPTHPGNYFVRTLAGHVVIRNKNGFSST
jgi:hypothetical protein